GEASEHDEAFLSAARAVDGDHAWLDGRHHRSVARHHRHLPFDAGKDDGFGLLRYEQPLGGHQVELESFSHVVSRSYCRAGRPCRPPGLVAPRGGTDARPVRLPPQAASAARRCALATAMSMPPTM